MTADHGADLGISARAGDAGIADRSGDIVLTATFGATLRARRQAINLTQAELAARAGIGVRTVRDLERGRASRPQRTTVHHLARALGLSGVERGDFHAAARVWPGTEPACLAAVPEAGLFIGRDQEVLDLAQWVVDVGGPVTVVGLAGVGKSTLARAVAHQIAERFPGGVAEVPVADRVTEPELLAAIATAFCLPKADYLPAQFAAAPALLLLDGVDRSVATSAAVLRALSVGSGLRVLATGRCPLDLPGVRVWAVRPLATPPTRIRLDLDTVAGYPAAELFLARLRQVRNEPLTGDEISALPVLARQLGGVPLALELAASRGRVLSLTEILCRYGHRILDLTGAQVGSYPGAGTPLGSGAEPLALRHLVDASYRLLGATERQSLRRLSVFRGWWSVELAEALLTDEKLPGGGPLAGDPVPLLDRLLVLGLATASGATATRFRLVEPVREYAAEQAAGHGELAGARRRHATVFTQLVARVTERAYRPAARGLAPLDEVARDLWAALSYAANDDPPTALHLAIGLTQWWRARGHQASGRRWLRRMLADQRTSGMPPQLRVRALDSLTELAGTPGAAPDVLGHGRSAIRARTATAADRPAAHATPA